MENEKRKRKLTLKREKLETWEEEDIDSKDEEENEEGALLYLMALGDETNEAYDSNLSCSSDDDEIDELYNELYYSLVMAKKDLKNKLDENALLHGKFKQLEKQNYDLNILAKINLSISKIYLECELF